MRFDHREPGTSEAAWVSVGVLDRPAPLQVEQVDALVVVAAHPDDESLGAGGLIGRLADRGVPVTVVVATDGEGSHPDDDLDELRAVRRREVADALAALAPAARLVLLGLPDGGLREHRAQLAERLDATLDAAGGPGGPGVVVCAPWRGDGHRDHRVAGEVAAQVAGRHGARLLEYPIWLWHWGDPSAADVPWGELRGLDLTARERRAKERAVRSHTSQVRPRSGLPAVVGQEMLRHAARTVEVFVEAEDASAGDAAAVGPGGSLGRDFFDRFYAGRDDPWGFESRWYEARKRAVLLASLPRARFRHALELGCSTGVLTQELAARCDRITGVDIADAPLASARERLGDDAELLRLDTPRRWPDGSFDLVVLSEVLYYYGRGDLDLTLDRVVRSLDADGVVVACHWRHEVPEYPLGGDEVHDVLRSRTDLAVQVRHEEDDFVLEVLARPPVRSVAATEGLR
ncbi:PIG-L family deacetylase [Isoptericola jiangsuensis]|uniref:PIG-L family deacetylase n=1 Tax=Isoptericola jiangsuensis TaxID=548579 RepID=UPI001FE6092C|nr:PIG-L family deacetylase [Isoptericola jiangsuensis]